METNKLPNFSLYWNGWKSNLYDLSRAGWSINVDRQYYDRTFVLALQNHLLKVVGLSNRLDDEFVTRMERNPDSCRGLRFEGTDWFPTLQMQYMSFKISIRIVEHNTCRYEPVTKLSLIPGHEVDLESLLSRNEHKTEAGIIVPEYTIPELMGLIKERQAPRQKEIRERLRKETNPNIITENISIVSVSGEILNEERYKAN